MSECRAKRDHKPHYGIYSQSQRRDEALRRLREERTKRCDAFRQLQLTSVEQEAWRSREETVLTESLTNDLNLSESSAHLDCPQRSSHTELMQALWMTEIPLDLAQNWLVMARPEGRRCVVEASKGRTVSRLKNGGILHSGVSDLPGGSSFTNGPSILDCIFHEPDCTYYVMDLLCWNGVWVMDCEALFRLHWIHSKLMESTKQHDRVEFPFKFGAVAFHECCGRGLLTSLYDFVPFIRDGICLLHKAGHYTSGPSELSLLWKDLTCSRYLVETDMDGTPTEYQTALLHLAEDGGIYTGDDPPVQFSHVNHCCFSQLVHKEQLKPQRLIRFRLYSDEEITAGGNGVHLEFVSFVRQRRRNADLFSKILFQRRAREGRIHSSDLIQSVQSQEGDAMDA